MAWLDLSWEIKIILRFELLMNFIYSKQAFVGIWQSLLLFLIKTRLSIVFWIFKMIFI